MTSKKISPTEKRLLLLVLLLTLTQGILRLIVVPLWAHYDEAAHYEYLRYIVEHHQLPPRTREPDLAILERIASTYSLEVVISVDSPCFYGDPDRLCLTAGHQFAQQMPGYYVLQSFFQIIAGFDEIEQEVFLARSVSVAMSIIVAWLAYLTVKEAFPESPILAVGVPLVMAAFITYTDLMSALSNDVGAITTYTLLIFALTLLVKRGFHLGRIFFVIIALTLCILTKHSAWAGIPLTLFGLLLTAWPWRPRVVLAAILAVVMVGILGAIDLRASANWSRHEMQSTIDRVRTDAPLGQHAFSVSGDAYIMQAVPPETEEELRGQTVTIGAWIRSPAGDMVAQTPILWYGNDVLHSRQIVATTDWAFHSMSLDIPSDAAVVAVRLGGGEEGIIEYDAVVLTVGDFPTDLPPEYFDPDAHDGVWEEHTFSNALRNGSAEHTWPLLRPEVNQLIPHQGINDQLETMYDWRRTWPAYWRTLRWLFVSFWAAVGAGLPSLPRWGIVPFAGLSGISLLGLLRALIHYIKSRQLQGYQWRIIALFAAAVSTALVGNLVWMEPVDVFGYMEHVTTSRFFLIAIVPTTVFLLVGAGTWLAPKPRRYGLTLLVFSMYVINVWSLLNVQMPILFEAAQRDLR